MSQFAPRASILMPVRDEARYLTEALASVLPATSDGQIEVILVDDHSCDNSLAIARHHAAQWPGLRVSCNPGTGKAAALNHAFRQARGDSFILLAGDDRIVADYLSERLDAVVGSGPRLACCRYQSFSDIPAFDGILFPRVSQANLIAGGAVSFNQAFAELYFPIPEDLPNEDTWLRAVTILHDLTPLRLPGIGLYFRIHNGNSIGPTHDFSAIDRLLAARNRAYTLALTHGDDAAGRPRLQALVACEEARANRRPWRLLTIRSLSMGERLSAFVNSGPRIYRLKQILYRLMRSL